MTKKPGKLQKVFSNPRHVRSTRKSGSRQYQKIVCEIEEYPIILQLYSTIRCLLADSRVIHWSSSIGSRNGKAPNPTNGYQQQHATPIRQRDPKRRAPCFTVETRIRTLEADELRRGSDLLPAPRQRRR